MKIQFVVAPKNRLDVLIAMLIKKQLLDDDFQVLDYNAVKTDGFINLVPLNSNVCYFEAGYSEDLNLSVRELAWCNFVYVYSNKTRALDRFQVQIAKA